MGMRLREPRNHLEARRNAVKGPEVAAELERCVQMKICVIRKLFSETWLSCILGNQHA